MELIISRVIPPFLLVSNVITGTRRLLILQLLLQTRKENKEITLPVIIGKQVRTGCEYESLNGHFLMWIQKLAVQYFTPEV